VTININLLPRSRRKIRQEPIILLLGLVLLFGCNYVLYQQYERTQAEKEQTERALAAARAQKEKLQQQLTAVQQSADEQDVAKYKELPQVIKAASVDTTFLFERLAALLPEGSLVSSLEYQAPDQVKVGIRFATIEEAVGFIQAVQQSPYFGVKSVGSVAESKAQGSLAILSADDKIASNYSLTFELTVKRNTLDEADRQTALTQQR
jgi:Tfp pilus assembly protein PilN